MEILDVTASLNEINLFPKNEKIEILQNIKTILTTIKGTVPLDRDFGIDSSVIDKPVTIVKPLIIKEIKEAIEKYEPRAKLISVDWKGIREEGKLVPIVKVVIR